MFPSPISRFTAMPLEAPRLAGEPFVVHVRPNPFEE